MQDISGLHFKPRVFWHPGYNPFSSSASHGKFSNSVSQVQIPIEKKFLMSLCKVVCLKHALTYLLLTLLDALSFRFLMSLTLSMMKNYAL